MIVQFDCPDDLMKHAIEFKEERGFGTIADAMREMMYAHKEMKKKKGGGQ